MGNATTVLIIDDSLSACQFMALTLEKVGYRVIFAADGHEGLMKAFQERPHCVILDVLLPGISGFEVCRRLRANDHYHRLPICSRREPEKEQSRTSCQQTIQEEEIMHADLCSNSNMGEHLWERDR